MSDLITLLESATEGSRELDARIALEVGGYSAWKSKHGYWNIDGPGDERLTCEGRDPVVKFDPETGRPLPPEEVPLGWIWDAKFGEVTTSIDAIVALIGEKLPGQFWSIEEHPDGFVATIAGPFHSQVKGVTLTTAPLALCVAFLRALKNVTDGR